MKLTPRLAMASAVLLGSAALIGGTGLTVSSAWLITVASQHPPILVLSVSIVMVRFFGISRSVARYGERVISHEAIFRKLTGLRQDIFTSISSRLNRNSVATDVKSAIDDVERAQEFYLRITLPKLTAILAGAVSLVIAYWISPLFLIITAPLYLVFALAIPHYVRRAIDPITIDLEEAETHYATLLSTATHAAIEALVYGYSEQLRKGLITATERLRSLEGTIYRRIALAQIAVGLSMGASIIGTAVLAENLANPLPVEISMSLFLLLVGFEGFTSWFPNLFIAGKTRRAAESVNQLLLDTRVNTSVIESPRNETLILQSVSPYWNEPFLPPISLTLNKGEVLVINGASGVGKSTLASALFGFAPYQGSISYGGVELLNLPAKTLAGTLQKAHIFNTSIRENLKIASSSASDIELIEILELLELSYLSLDEVVGEFGRVLSGGEAKRIAIARALIAQSSVVILDEPLEHLDSQLALRIQPVIARLCSDKALIVITHAPWLQYSQKALLTRE